ncbi:pentapeptide repeat-containing protein [Aquihabitans sp. McL0605]|uniref:pentapeptide repeat-containing protein n=1 Tax=Aquihabitans sp. McL0605 TaxID=3415671 RepID=UPI003CEF7568
MWSRRVASFGFSLVVGLGSAAFLTSCEPGPECTGRWVGPVGGAFSTPANWEAGAVPTAADRICAPETASIVVDGDATIGSADVKGAIAVPAGSTLTVTGTEGSRVADLELAGTLDGAGLVEVGALDWTGGTMAGTGRTDVSAATPMTLADDVALLGSRTLYLRNAVDWTGGAISMCGDSVLGVMGTLTATGPDSSIGSDGCRSIIDPRLFITGLLDVESPTAIHAGAYNFGSVTIEDGITLEADTYEQRPGLPTPATTALGTGATLSVDGGDGAADLTAGRLTGSGTIDGDVTGVVTIAPGVPADGGTGTLTVTGDLSASTGTTLAIDIAGASPGTGHDQLAIGGTAGLAAIGLTTDLVDGYVPAAGDAVQAVSAGTVTGTFASAELPAGDDPFWQLDYASTTATLRAVHPNRAPVATADVVAIKEDTAPNPVFADVLGNDTDPDGDALTVTNPGTHTLSHGILVLNANGSYAFVLDDTNSEVNALNDGEHLTDAFTYHVSDGHGGTDSTTVTVTINGTTDPVNHVPEATSDAATVDQWEVLTMAAPGVLANDTDADGDALTAHLVDDVSDGELALGADGSYSYTPASTFSGTDSFTYDVSDGRDTSDPATVTITIHPVARCASKPRPGVDWSGCDLTGRRDLHQVDLTGANLSGAKVPGLHQVDLTGANLAGAEVKSAWEVNFEGANLAGASFHDGYVAGSNFHNANMSGTDLSISLGYPFIGVGFSLVRSGGISGTPIGLPSWCRFSDGYFLCPGVDLSGSDLAGRDLSGADLAGASLAGADLRNADLAGSSLRCSANLGRCVTLNGATVTGARLSGIDADGLLSGGLIGQPATLPARAAVRHGYLFAPGVDLRGLDLSGYDLTDLDLTGTQLAGSNLTGTSLSAATLEGNVSGGITGIPASLPDGWRLHSGWLLGVRCGIDGAVLANLELSGMDLHGCSMRDTKLSGLNLQGANLSGVYFSNSTLTNLDLTDADLTNAVLVETSATGVMFQGADLTGGNFKLFKSSGLLGTPAVLGPYRMVNGHLAGPAVDLSGADLSGADLSNFALSGARLTGANFRNADLSGSDLFTAEIGGADFTGATFKGLRSWRSSGTPAALPAGWFQLPATLIGPYAFVPSSVDLTSFDLHGADLNHAQLSGVRLERANLNGANLSGADLSNSNLDFIHLAGADLSYADLHHSAMTEATLNDVDASYANFDRALAQGSNWSGAVLKHASFRAVADRAIFFGTDLSYADLTYASFESADFHSANLTGATVTGTYWGWAGWGNTTCPDGTLNEADQPCR